MNRVPNRFFTLKNRFPPLSRQPHRSIIVPRLVLLDSNILERNPQRRPLVRVRALRKGRMTHGSSAPNCHGSGSTKILEPIATDSLSKPSSDSESETKSTWADLVTNSGSKMKKKGDPFTLESGELCIKIPDKVITRNLSKWEHFIIAQFHGNAPTPRALHVITNGFWSSRLRDITVSKLSETVFLIRIPSPQTRHKVLVQGMWHI